jgi:hypothetical protein
MPNILLAKHRVTVRRTEVDDADFTYALCTSIAQQLGQRLDKPFVLVPSPD